MAHLTRTRLAIILLVAAHAVFLAYLYHTQGILADKEALKFTGSAEALLRGDPHDLLHRYPTYATTILFLVPFVALGYCKLAILAQVALGLFAAFRLRDLVLRTTGSPQWAWTAMAGLLLSYLVQTWTLSLYSESLMTSLGILLVERCTRPGSSVRDPWIWSIALLVLFARPVGILFVVPCLFQLLRKEQLIHEKILISAAFGLLLFLFLLPMDRETVVEPILRGEVMYGVPQWEMPLMDGLPNHLIGAHWVLLKKIGPLAWLRLSVAKALHLFVLTRPYYSTAHNTILLLHYAVYPLAALAIFRHKEPAVWTAWSVLLLHMAVIALTYTEWNSRFMTPLWPMLLLLGATGGQWIVHRSRKAGLIT